MSITLVRLAGIFCCVAAVWGSAACGGAAAPGPGAQPASAQAAGQPASARPSGPAADATDPTPGEAASPAGATGAGSAGHGAAPMTEAECQALLAHLVAVANAAHVENVAPELAPTDEQIADIRARLAPRFVPACLTMDRGAFVCEMRARSRDELLACAEAPAP